VTVTEEVGSEAANPPESDPSIGEPDLDRSGSRPSEDGVIEVFRVALVVLSAALLSMALFLVVFSRFEYSAAQHRAFDRLRGELAAATAPTGPIDASGRLLPLGTPVALLEIPAIHLREVVGEGTTSAVLMSGPGHRRDTPFPGQAGTTYIFGRAAAYGGPFRRLHELKPGARITITTGEGASTYKVIDVRRAGQPRPPSLGTNHGRVTLATATGAPFVPSGVVYVDADQVSPVLVSTGTGVPAGALPADERPMATETGALWVLVLWLEALIVAAVAMVWSWYRWGRAQTWIVFVPLTVLVGFFLSAQITRLLPNLM
jgi:LPXTG-site transpeptidase (sortase) family protein